MMGLEVHRPRTLPAGTVNVNGTMRMHSRGYGRREGSGEPSQRGEPVYDHP